MADLDYKQKYFDLRAKFLRAVDTAYRLGYEEGAKESQQQQAAAQLQDAQNTINQMSAGQTGQPQPDQSQPDQGGQPQDPMGQSMEELGQAVAKSENEKEALSFIAPLIGKSAHHNLDQNSKIAHTMQKKIVDNLMKKWDEESTKAVLDITKNIKNV